MAELPRAIANYRAKRAVTGLWHITPVPDRQFAGAVVIPAREEAAHLLFTIASLADNPAGLLDRFMILVVVNNREDAAEQEKVDNEAILQHLPDWQRQYGLKNLFRIDAASPGAELPVKQGVGLARKIGLDLALAHLDYHNGDPLLVCLDADTLVQPDYLSAIISHFSHSHAGGASIPYRHRPAADPVGQRAIDRYELFLRAYVLGLELAGSPYAFHSVGSAMACRASAYAAAGGMNRRLAGEDFYFLQQIHKTSEVETLAGTVVHPSPRSSHRVPFGTGRSVGDMLTEGERHLLFYQPVVFSILGEWLTCVTENTAAEADMLLNGASCISPFLREFLEQAGFSAAWGNLKRNNDEGKKLLKAFHVWFDAFKTMQLVHYLTRRSYPRIAPEEAVAPLLYRAAEVVPENVGGQLELLRGLQGAGT